MEIKDGIEFSAQLKPWYNAIQKQFPKDIAKCAALATNISCALDIADFLYKIKGFVDVPMYIQYRCALICQFYYCLTNRNTVSIKTISHQKDLEDKDLEKRLALVAKEMYEECKRRGLYD